MAYTQEQVTALEAAIAQGATVVQYSDKKIEYRSLAEMKAILREMKNALGLNPESKSGILGPKIIFSVNKGL